MFAKKTFKIQINYSTSLLDENKCDTKKIYIGKLLKSHLIILAFKIYYGQSPRKEINV